MSIEKTEVRYVYEIYCDKCGASEEIESEFGFGDVYSQAKEDGWRAFKEPDGSWGHSCPDCVEEFKWKGGE